LGFCIFMAIQMKRALLFLLYFTLVNTTLAAELVDSTVVRLQVNIPTLKLQKLYMGSYFGKFQTVLDSLVLSNSGQGEFRAKKKYVSGIYFLASERKELLTEFLMDSAQQFSIFLETPSSAPEISGSVENTYFSQYNAFLAKFAPEMSQLQAQLKQASPADSLSINKAIATQLKSLDAYRATFQQKYPKALLSFLFQASKRPDAPSKTSITKPEDWYAYYQAHFWEGTSLADPRLLRTPFFDQKLEEFLSYYVSPNPDELIKTIDDLIKQTGDEQGECFRYLFSKLTDRYVRPQVMGQDKVFVHLFSEYYTKKDFAWLSAQQKKFIFDRGYSLVSNQIGNPAPALQLSTLAGERQDIYALKAPYTLLVFWDPNCSHCLQDVPQLDSLYQANWKKLGLKMVGINIDEQAQTAWKAFIHKYHLQDWLHLYQPESEKLAEQKNQIPNYRQLYDVVQTPTLYLLDANKKIVAKNLDAKGIDRFLTQQLKR
jgi:peroxiredoxin